MLWLCAKFYTIICDQMAYMFVVYADVLHLKIILKLLLIIS